MQISSLLRVTLEFSLYLFLNQHRVVGEKVPTKDDEFALAKVGG